MASYRKLLDQNDGESWYLMSPSNFFEAVKMAWMLYRYKERFAALVCIKNEFIAEKCNIDPPNAPLNGKRSDPVLNG